MKRQYLIFSILSLASLNCLAASELKYGEKVIVASVSLYKDDSAKVQLTRMIYSAELNRKELKSKPKTDWVLRLLEKNGKVIESNYAEFEDDAGITCSLVAGGDYATNVAGGDYVTKLAFIIFKFSKDAYQVELLFKDKRKAVALVSESGGSH